MKELFDLIAARRSAPQVPYAVATVLRVEGSSYRRPGARMLINMHGRVAGSISGGCLEKAVISEGRCALTDGKSRLLAFDTTDQDDLALGASLGCEGKIWISVEVVPVGTPWILEAVADQVRLEREPVILVTRVLDRESTPRFEMAAFPASKADAAALDLLKGHKTRYTHDDAGNGLLMEWLSPPLALWLFGAGPDVTSMIVLARGLGHEVTVIDPRPEFATAENFPGAQRVLAADGEQAVEKLQADDRTVAVLMNHRYDVDRDALAALMPLDLAYIALLGPKRRTQRILEELAGDGYDVGTVSKALHGPAGLDIGSESPEEIALAILAEAQATLAHRQGGKLRQREMPIHSETYQPDSKRCSVPA